MRGFFYAPEGSFELRVTSFELISSNRTVCLAARNSRLVTATSRQVAFLLSIDNLCPQ